jgi:ComEC/Rec2-related protein
VTGIAIGAACVAGFAIGRPAVILLAVILIGLRAGRRVTAVWAIAVLAAGACGVLRTVPEPESANPVWSDDVDALRGVVASGPMSSERGQRYSLVVAEIRQGRSWQSADLTLCMTGAELPQLRPGDHIFAVVTVERFEDLPSGIGKAFSARGCSAAATAWRTVLVEPGRGWRHALDGLRRSMSTRLQAAAPGDGGALLAGLVTGDDGALSDDAREAFVATGTTHITAVSGSNVAIVLVSMVALGGWFGVHRRFMWQTGTAAGVWGYALLVGLEPPALRAAIVATGAVFAVAFGRRADLVTLTVLAAGLQLLYRPSDYWTLSFRLSFASALALALVLRGAGRNGARGLLVGGLAATMAAQIATAPALISVFGRVSTLSLPTNVAISPFVAIAFPIAIVASLLGLVSESLGDAAVAPGLLSARAVLGIAGAIAGMPGSQLVVGRPGVVGNIVLVAGSAAIVAALSRDCRRAAGDARRWAQTQNRSTLMLGVAGCVGFAIGLIAGAVR